MSEPMFTPKIDLEIDYHPKIDLEIDYYPKNRLKN